jgi:small subunit ribosomal protein S1
MASVEEKLPFKLIEFNKEAKRIVVSHSRIHEDEAKSEAKQAATKKSSAKKSAKKEEAENQEAPKVEKTTLGDIDALAALKEQLDNQK